jgi:AraC-like DNA-binding protein
LVDVACVDKMLSRTPECESRRHFRPALVKDPQAVQAMLELVAALRAPVSDAGHTNELLATFLMRIFRRAQDAPSEVPPSAIDRIVERARAFVNEHYAEKIGLDQVAKAAGMSKFHLERTFHSKLGLPIHQYLKRVRIGRALELLRAGRRPIHVARLVGFADQPHLTRVLSSDLGFTPSQYLRGRGAQDSRAAGYSVSSSLSEGGLESSSPLAVSFCGRGIP